jgi:hypothetical protein
MGKALTFKETIAVVLPATVFIMQASSKTIRLVEAKLVKKTVFVMKDESNEQL